MNRVIFPPANSGPIEAGGRPCPAVSGAAAARPWFFPRNASLRPLSFLLALAALFGPQMAGAAEGQQIIKGHLPAVIQQKNLQSTGELPAETRLNLAIGLPLRNKGEFTDLLRQLYDPASPNYKKYLTTDQFTARFGPSQEDYDKLKNFLTAHGLKVTATHPNRVVLDVNLSVADIQKVFHVRMKSYDHPSEHRSFFAPDAEPSIDLDVPILHVSGLDNYRLPRPMIHKGVPAAQARGGKALMGTGLDGNYFGYDFRNAYAPGVTLTGSGQSLALVEFDTYYPSDITTYETLAGLPDVPLLNVPVDGFSGPPGIYDDEVSLDIEMAVAMAPGLSRILVYEAPVDTYPMNDILTQIATDNLASQISMSWVLTDDPTTDVILEEIAAQGQSFFESSGDEGSFNYASLTQTGQDDDPYVTLVGGTTLTTTNNGAYLSETVWNWETEYPDEGITGASGGGISVTYPLPTWQQGIANTNNLASATFRNIPDVALTADNIFEVEEDGVSEVEVGGTSAAAPLWAAFCALINEKASLTGTPPVGFINPEIYRIGKGLRYNADFHDITNGNNTNTAFPTEYFAVVGYDLCTGWGTPTGQSLIDTFVPAAISVPILSVVSNNLSGGNGNGKIDPDECNSLNVLITNEGAFQATGVQGILTSLTPGVIIASSVVSYPNLPPGQSAWNQTPFTISTESSFVCGTPVSLQLVIKCNQTTQTNFLEFATGGIGAPVEFDNSTPLSIAASAIYGISSINVSNIATVGKVTASVYLTTPDAGYMYLELIGPDGMTYSMLTEPSLESGANFGNACYPNSARTIFDDASTNSILNGVAPTVGTYSPATPLSVFNLMSGASVNGTWQLYVENLLYDACTLNCWSLFISPEQCPDGGGQCPGSDLSITMSASPITTPTFSPVTYTMVVSNSGPSPAPDTVVNQTLPAGVIYQGAVTSQGTVSQAGSLVTFSLGTMGVYSNATIIVTTEAVEAGLWTSTAAVGATNANPNPSSNNTSASVLVTKPLADVALTLGAAPASLPVNGQATFTLTVTNNGPATALGVTITNTLPANANVVSVSSTKGSITPGGTLVSIGTLLPNTGATATVVLSPTVVGTCAFSSIVGIDPSEVDPVLDNNSASISITALPAADLGVSVVVSPNPAISGTNLAYVITVTNAGPAAASSVFMNQTLPASVTLVSTSQTNAVDIDGLVTWTIGDMAGGTSQTLTNIVQAPTLIQGVISNFLVSTFSVAGQPGDPNTNNNYAVVSTVLLRPTVIITPLADTLIWQSFQPPNGAVEPGETVQVSFQLENIGNIPSTNLVATLQTNGAVVPMQTNSSGVPIPGKSSFSYGALAPGGGVGSGLFMFSNNAADGGTAVATLQLQDGPTNYGTVSFTFIMPVVSAFQNASVISIPATNYVATNQAMGPAGPFPSALWVSGLSSYVSDVAVTVSNLEHTYPSDISLWVVGPGGQSAMLMSYAALHSSAAIPVTITFDQNASNVVPQFGSLYSGSYQPAEYSPPVFPSGVTNISPPVNTNLSVFQGVSPDGAWYLCAYDSKAGDYGAISNGWSVAVTTITPVNQITDIGVAASASAGKVVLGSNITFTITVSNLGTNAATVFLTNVLAAGLSFVSNSTPSFAPYQTNLTPTNQTQLYNLGVLPGQTNLTLGYVAYAAATNSQTNTVVYVGSSLLDPNTNNNQASVAVTVVPPTADVAAAISSSAAGTLVIGSNVIYALSVTNYGPGLAFNVTGILTNGVSGSSAAVFSNFFGNLAPGSSATLFFTNTPAVIGYITNVWTVATGSLDTNFANTSATNILSVTYPEPVIVAAGATVLSGNFALNGAINPNETVTVAFNLENSGVAPATNLIAALQSGSGVVPVTASQSYGNISPGASVARNFTFTAGGASGSAITAVFALTNNGAYWGTVSFPFVVSSLLSFTNSGWITIPDSGPGTPYPSVITVASTNNGVIGKVTVTLLGFTHSFPHDVNILLTSPSGLQTVLMAHVGGPYSVTNLVLSFDDAAAASLSTNILVSNTTNHPTQIPPLDSFPAIYGQPSNTNLAIFNGGNPNGNWSLYVYDDTPGNDGDIANGWSLGLSIIIPVNPPGSLALGMSHAPDPVFTNNLLDFSITVTNLGPFGATNVSLTDTLPANSSLVSVAASQGAVTTNVPGFATFNFGNLAYPGATATATIQVQPRLPGSAANSATATDASGSSASASNSVSVTTAALPSIQAAFQAKNLALTLSGQPGQTYILQLSTNLVSWSNISTNVADSGGQFTFAVNVTNAPVRFYRALHLPQ
jgi:uncharacterized repeat protein (TIGR01451 family)